MLNAATHDHEQQDHEHDRLGELDRAEEIRVVARPVADVEDPFPSATGDVAARTTGARTDRRSSSRRPVTASPSRYSRAASLEVHEREAAVEFVHAGVEDAADA